MPLNLQANKGVTVLADVTVSDYQEDIEFLSFRGEQRSLSGAQYIIKNTTERVYVH